MPRSPAATELYKDKIEIVLDSRQIFYLFFGGSVIVGMVFVLGVMVGRRLEARGHLPLTHPGSTVDPLAALDRLGGGAGLSFQGNLRRSNAPAAKGDNAAAPRAKVDSADDKNTGAQNPAEKKLDRQKVDVEPPTEGKKAQGERSDHQKADDKKAENNENNKPIAQKPDAPKAESKSKYALQLSSFQVKSEAEGFQSQVKANGFGAYITEAQVDGKTYYRVRVGYYRSLDAAKAAKSEIEKALQKSAAIMKL